MLKGVCRMIQLKFAFMNPHKMRAEELLECLNGCNANHAFTLEGLTALIRSYDKAGHTLKWNEYDCHLYIKWGNG